MQTLTNLDVATIVEQEGLDYAITAYINSNAIEDKKLATLWQKAAEILNEIENILELEEVEVDPDEDEYDLEEEDFSDPPDWIDPDGQFGIVI